MELDLLLLLKNQLSAGEETITTDYINGGTNTGKLLAFVGTLKECYKLIPSSIGTVGYDASISNILDGVCPAGKVSSAAHGIVLKEGLKVLTSL